MSCYNCTSRSCSFRLLFEDRWLCAFKFGDCWPAHDGDGRALPQPRWTFQAEHQPGRAEYMRIGSSHSANNSNLACTAKGPNVCCGFLVVFHATFHSTTQNLVKPLLWAAEQDDTTQALSNTRHVSTWARQVVESTDQSIRIQHTTTRGGKSRQTTHTLRFKQRNMVHLRRKHQRQEQFTTRTPTTSQPRDSEGSSSTGLQYPC